MHFCQFQQLMWLSQDNYLITAESYFGGGDGGGWGDTMSENVTSFKEQKNNSSQQTIFWFVGSHQKLIGLQMWFYWLEDASDSIYWQRRWREEDERILSGAWKVSLNSHTEEMHPSSNRFPAGLSPARGGKTGGSRTPAPPPTRTRELLFTITENGDKYWRAMEG